MTFEEIQEQTGWERQHSPLVLHDEHIPVATQVAELQSEQRACTEFLLHGVCGENRRPDATKHRFLDALVAAEFEGNLEIGK